MHHARFLFAASTTFASLLLVSGCGSSNAAGPLDSGAPAVESGALQDSGVTADTGGGGADASTHDSAAEASMTMECALPDGGFPTGYPAAHAPFPGMVYGGAPLLTKPEVVTVTFPGDTLAPQLEAFGDNILQSCWWDTVRQGYCDSSNNCIGRGVVPAKAHVELSTAASASYTDAQIQAFIQNEVASGDFPPPDAGTIYVIYFPASTSIDYGGALTCSSGVLGYHGSVTVSGTSTTYAVLPECNFAEFGFNSLIDELTFDASHEITESATDPFLGGGTGGYRLDFQNRDSFAWQIVFTGGEVGDLCEDPIGELQHVPNNWFTAQAGGGSYLTQRMWSAPAATLGGDPCGPIGPGDAPYFNVAIASGSGEQVLTVGSSVTFPATAFSSAPLADWTLLAYDYTALETGTPSSLSISFAGADGGVTSTVGNGDTVMVTVKLNSMPPQITQGINGAVYLLLSSSGGKYHYWPGLIVAQ